MITYAQNFEDVILARAFRDRRRGFYIDVGACYPDVASVTRHFYELGWSGINVEPMEEPFLRLSGARVRDLNIRAAIADHCGEIAVFPGASVGESSALRGDPGVLAVTVPCLTLAELCRRHVRDPIDFLKVDVEGLELQVVRGGDWRSWRPKVVVIEISEPWSSKRRPDAAEIARLFDDAGYSEVYFDGLNAFYVASEAANLGALLACPPNVLDHFQTEREARLDTVSEAASANETRAAEQTKRSEALELRLREAIAGWRTTESNAALHAERMDELGSKMTAVNVGVEATAARIGAVARQSGSLERAIDDLARAATESRSRFDAALSRLETQAAGIASEVATANRWAESAVNDLVRRLEHAELRAVAAESRARGAETNFAAIEASRSWRWMAPLRSLRAALRAVSWRRGPADGLRVVRRWIVVTARRAGSRGRRSPTCLRAARALRQRFPTLWVRAKRAFQRFCASSEVISVRPSIALTPQSSALIRDEGANADGLGRIRDPQAQALTARTLADMIRQEAARGRTK